MDGCPFSWTSRALDARPLPVSSEAVYLIDDDPLAIKRLENALVDQTGYSVAAFQSPESLWAAIRERKPDVVVADLHMPAVGGLDLLDEIGDALPEVVGILMVNFGDPKLRAALAQLGPLRVVNKPCDVRDLQLKISAGVERACLERELGDLRTELARAKRRLADIEREARTATKRLVEAEQLAAVGRVVSGIAHEIGTQLALVGYAEAIKSRVADDPELTEFADIIVAAQRRLSAMVDEIRDFAAGPGAERALHREPSELAGLVDEAMAILQYERGVRDRRLELDYKARPLVSVNRQKLQQVAINLVSNAVLATEPGATITVEVDADETEGVAMVSVVDTGAGMSSDVLERLGEPFFSTREGSGLGVGICKRILEEHHGRLEFHSSPGKGTRATAVLPLLEIDA